MTQLPLNPELIHGPDVNSFDVSRLKGQLLDIWNVLKDGHWCTLSEIEIETGHPQASISARLRAFRSRRHGSHTVEKRRRFNEAHGTWEYKLSINPGGLQS